MVKKSPIKMSFWDSRILTYFYEGNYPIKKIAELMGTKESEIKIKKNNQVHKIVRWFCKEFGL